MNDPQPMPTDAELMSPAYDCNAMPEDCTDATLAAFARVALVGVEPAATVHTINGVTIGYLETSVPVGTKLYTAEQVLAMGRVPPSRGNGM